MHRQSPSIVLWCAVLALGAASAPAQSTVPSLTGCHAIVGARVRVSPDRELPRATIVVRDGLIEALGEDLEIPGDADRLEGAGLTVTAGFTVFGGRVPAAEEAPRGDEGESVDPDRQPDSATMGLTPAVDAASRFRERPLDAAPWIRAGVTTLIVAPEGRAAAGHAAIVDNRLDVAPDARLRRLRVAQVMAFQRAARGYPASTMGIVAALRQLFLDARHHHAWRRRHESRPAGTPVPPERRDLQALFEVLDGAEPVLFAARRPGDVRRAIELSRAFGFRLWIRGGAALDEARSALDGSGAATILDLDPGKIAYRENRALLEPPKKPEAAAEAPDPASKPAEEESPFLRARREAARRREREDLEHLLLAGSRFAEQEIPFALALEKPEELLKLVRAHVRQGLPAREALAALTTTPARLLGLESSQGRLVPGAVADLVLFRGEPFEDGRVAHVFCRGQRIDVDAGAKKGRRGDAGGPGVALADLAGTWTTSDEDSGEARPLTLALADGRLTGTLGMRRGEARIVEVRVDGRTVTMDFEAELGDRRMTGTFTGSLARDGRELAGTLDFGGRFQREATFTRTPQETRP